MQTIIQPPQPFLSIQGLLDFVTGEHVRVLTKMNELACRTEPVKPEKIVETLKRNFDRPLSSGVDFEKFANESPMSGKVNDGLIGNTCALVIICALYHYSR